MILEKRNNYFKQLFPVILGFFASTIVFREFSAIILAILFLVCLFFYKELRFCQKKRIEYILIATPLCLNIIFFWNNESFFPVFKELEKYTAFLILPIMILFVKREINFNRIIKSFSFFFTSIIFLGFLTYLIFNFESFLSYLNGDLVWKMGYEIAGSMGVHAPALNMHISFLCFVNLHLFFRSFTKDSTKLYKLSRALFLVFSVLILLIINTRIAIFTFFSGLTIYILYFTFLNKKPLKLNILIVFVLVSLLIGFLKIFPYTIEKFTHKTFNNIEMIGKIDQIDKPEEKIYGSLVTRATVWQMVLRVNSSDFVFGKGVASAYPSLFETYKKFDQKFLLKYKYKVHNQFMDFYLKFGIFGLIFTAIFFLNILRIALNTKSSCILFFFFLFISVNMIDDFLIRYDGIAFSAFWITVFSKYMFDQRSQISNISSDE